MNSIADSSDKTITLKRSKPQALAFRANARAILKRGLDVLDTSLGLLVMPILANCQDKEKINKLLLYFE